MKTVLTPENLFAFVALFGIYHAITHALENMRHKDVEEHHDVLDIVDAVTQCSCPDNCPRCGEPVITTSCIDERWHRAECQHCHLSIMTHDKIDEDGLMSQQR